MQSTNVLAYVISPSLSHSHTHLRDAPDERTLDARRCAPPGRTGRRQRAVHTLVVGSPPQHPRSCVSLNSLTRVLLYSVDVFCSSVWLSIMLTGSITQIVKITVGRPRPGAYTVLNVFLG